MSLAASLAVLIEDGIIEEVLGRIMSGKEAEVYAVRYHGHAVAAKVYKAREHRSFKNNSAYTEGRSTVRDTRSRRALEKGSAFGKSLAERGWKDMEHHALQLAFHVGVRVPQPILLYENVLLMELILDEHEQPAPRMSDLAFDAEQAVALYKDAFEQIRLLLTVHRIHGDLSPYNILMGVNGPTIIDMPQAVDAAANLRAPEFLERDVRNVTEYLARFAPQLAPYAGNGLGLWQHYRLGTLDAADPLQVAQPPRSRKRGGRPEGDSQPERVRRSDGRVEVVFASGPNGGQRGGRGLSRDGRAQGRAVSAPQSASPPRPRREEARPPDRGPRRDDRPNAPPRPQAQSAPQPQARHPQPGRQPEAQRHPQPARQPEAQRHPQPARQPEAQRHPQPARQPEPPRQPRPGDAPRAPGGRRSRRRGPRPGGPPRP